MSVSTILNLAALCDITGYARAGDVERCLRQQGIKVFHGKGGAPWTTLELVNFAGGIQAAVSNESDSYTADTFK